MLNNNIKRIVLLFSLCFLLISIVSAANSNDTITSEKNTDNSINNVSSTSSNVINKKVEITDNTYKNVKTTTTTTKQKSKLTLSLNQTKAILNDKVKVSVALKDANNKAIKNQMISIKIGSKTYKVKTNTNGKANLTYKVTSNAVLGKNITATYAGNTKYKWVVARKALLSNEQSYYTKQMIVVGKDTIKIGKYLEDDTTFSSFTKEYNYKTKILNSANTLLNKDITVLTNLKKYVTDKNRISYIDTSIKQFKLVKNIISQFKYDIDTAKLAVNGKISYNTFDNRISASEKKITQLQNNLTSLEKKLNSLEKKYPYVIKGFEKYCQ